MATSNVGKLLKDWRTAWEASNGAVPISFAIDKELAKGGASITDVLTAVALAKATPKDQRTKDQTELLKFADRTKRIQEAVLVEHCTETTQGSMFILEASHGYKRGSSDMNVTVQQKATPVWGQAQAAPEKTEG